MKKRSGLGVMAGLIKLIKPLLLIMAAAVIMGCIGNLSATFITIIGGYGLLSVLGIESVFSLKAVFAILAVLAVIRGILRYAEQACNHYIAFKLLAKIRHEVFKSLRRLAPAKLDGSDRGNLVALITSDIELLEVFYAHTISPVLIAIITSIIMIIFIGKIHILLAFAACAFYLAVGLVIPYLNGRKGKKDGEEYREQFGNLNSAVLDNLYGLDETLQYNLKAKRSSEMEKRTDDLSVSMKRLKKNENVQSNMTNTVIMLAGAVFMLTSVYLYSTESITMAGAVIAVISILSSFGPVAALSALSNNLTQTLACGNRVLDLLEEEPVVNDVKDGKEFKSGDIECSNVSFSYDGNTKILDNLSENFKENKIHGILGKSGSGKSTLLKLMMRFYETEKGIITYNRESVNKINTDSLRDNISYVTQETFLFNDTIMNNIRIADFDADDSKVIEAAKKASIHEFISSLPDGYNTVISETGDSVSGGEKQRIGIARAFLHNSPVIVLDEPTSNIDSLNEGIILKSLKEEKKNKTIILVSHRKSTMGIADNIIRK